MLWVLIRISAAFLKSAHNTGFYEAKAIQMSTNNIGFYGEIWTFVSKLSSNTHLVHFSAYPIYPLSPRLLLLLEILLLSSLSVYNKLAPLGCSTELRDNSDSVSGPVSEETILATTKSPDSTMSNVSEKPGSWGTLETVLSSFKASSFDFDLWLFMFWSGDLESRNLCPLWLNNEDPLGCEADKGSLVIRVSDSFRFCFNGSEFVLSLVSGWMSSLWLRGVCFSVPVSDWTDGCRCKPARILFSGMMGLYILETGSLWSIFKTLLSIVYIITFPKWFYFPHDGFIFDWHVD